MSSETYAAGPEMAPSALTEDQASFARTVGLTGLMAVVLGTLILILNAAKAKLGGRDRQQRRVRGHRHRHGDDVLPRHPRHRPADPPAVRLRRRHRPAAVRRHPLALAGDHLGRKPAPEDGSPKPIVSLFFPFGWACFLAGLFFLIPFCRNETDPEHRRYGIWAMVVIGGLPRCRWPGRRADRPRSSP